MPKRAGSLIIRVGGGCASIFITTLLVGFFIAFDYFPPILVKLRRGSVPELRQNLPSGLRCCEHVVVLWVEAVAVCAQH